MSEPWYVDGLHFECTKCGRCCSGTTGYVWTDEAEIRRLAAATGLALDEFGRRYLRRVGSRYALTENPVSGDCALLRDGLCSVHEARPEQCRTFPFWPSHLESEQAWRVAALECEGIVVDAARTAGEGSGDESPTPLFTRERIESLRRARSR